MSQNHPRSGPRDHADVARAPALAARDTFELRVHGHVAEDGIVLVAGRSAWPGSRRGRRRPPPRPRARCARGLGLDVARVRPRRRRSRPARGDPRRTSAPLRCAWREQHVVEALARHLVGLRASASPPPARSRRTGRRCRRWAVKLAPHFFTNPGLEDVVLAAERRKTSLLHGSWRLADVEAGEPLALQEEHAATLPRERGGGAGAARASADDRHVEALSVLGLESHTAP